MQSTIMSIIALEVVLLAEGCIQFDEHLKLQHHISFVHPTREARSQRMMRS